MNRDRFSEYLKDKSVCLVGPAPSIKELGNQKEFIDSHDIVVRINKSLPVPKTLFESSGTKTNILYNCLNVDPESGGYLHIPYLEEEIEWLACPYPNKAPFSGDIQRFIGANSDRINFTYFDLRYYNELETKMKTRPNSGVLTILDLLSHDIRSLHITGITFFRGGYVNEYREYNEQQVLARMQNHGNHKQEPQIQYMKKILKEVKGVTYDKFLEEIVNE
jgi:hypothetical protein